MISNPAKTLICFAGVLVTDLVLVYVIGGKVARAVFGGNVLAMLLVFVAAVPAALFLASWWESTDRESAAEGPVPAAVPQFGPAAAILDPDGGWSTAQRTLGESSDGRVQLLRAETGLDGDIDLVVIPADPVMVKDAVERAWDGVRMVGIGQTRDEQMRVTVR